MASNWTLPLRPVALGLEPSFGFGDRIGLATAGHVASLAKAPGIAPIFAQQSIREMTRTQRLPQQVMSDALYAAYAAGYRGPSGADADHLKTADDARRTMDAGFVMFTIDPSDHVETHADNFTSDQLQHRYQAVRDEVKWIEAYHGQTVKLATGAVLHLDAAACTRAAVKYGRAVNHTVSLAASIRQGAEARHQEYEIELSVDETPQPTTLAEHYIVASECLRQGVKIVSLAPRFIGDFEKGVDFKGDLCAFEKSLADHAAIAALVGPYKLSLHSGSDKLSIYGMIARQTKARFHVKTAGTSYLEALRVVAKHDPRLFRRMIDFARAHYDTDKATYHVSATLASAPDQQQVASDAQLEELYLGVWDKTPAGIGFTQPGRQILHCTFGSLLTDPSMGPALREILERHAATYTEVLALHFDKHLQALRSGM